MKATAFAMTFTSLVFFFAEALPQELNLLRVVTHLHEFFVANRVDVVLEPALNFTHCAHLHNSGCEFRAKAKSPCKYAKALNAQLKFRPK